MTILTIFGREPPPPARYTLVMLDDAGREVGRRRRPIYIGKDQEAGEYGAGIMGKELYRDLVAAKGGNARP